MARKLRLEFPGANYHVINRGNYRAAVFGTDGAKAVFERCLFEACERSGWRLHAYVMMSNHYHLAVETPAGNLIAGMQWLQATFANRFNRLRGEHGHLFQGRYKSLLVEPGPALGQVCHYLHLNPARAGVQPIEQLSGYRYSSFWYLFRPERRPAFLTVETALRAAGDLPDQAAGWTSYAAYLGWQMQEGPAGRNRTFISMSRGWAIGSREFREALVKDHALVADARAWEQEGATEIRERSWQKTWRGALEVIGQNEAALTHGPILAPWKVALVAFMKERTQASNGWLARQLGCTRPVYLSKLVGELRRKDRVPPDLQRLRETGKT